MVFIHREPESQWPSRASKARSRASGGADLGLSIALWAVERQEAPIELEGVSGHGTFFRIVIPTEEQTDFENGFCLGLRFACYIVANFFSLTEVLIPLSARSWIGHNRCPLT
jgi:hypothetical protein